MRDILQTTAAAAVIAVAALCALVQLSHADQAVDRLHDRAVIEQVSSGTGGNGHHSVR